MALRDCQHPWNWAVISSNGEVRPCCFATLPVGNLHQEPLEAIWNGPALQQLRLDILAGRVNPVCAGAPCKYVQGDSPD